MACCTTMVASMSQRTTTFDARLLNNATMPQAQVTQADFAPRSLFADTGGGQVFTTTSFGTCKVAKPATNTRAEAEKLYALAREKNLVLLEAFHYR